MKIYDVKLSEHSKNSHPQNHREIQNILRQHPPYQIWKDISDNKKFYLIVQLKSGRWGVQVVEKEEEDLREKTCYVPKDGTWNKLIMYLSQRAVRYTGEI